MDLIFECIWAFRELFNIKSFLVFIASAFWLSERFLFETEMLIAAFFFFKS